MFSSLMVSMIAKWQMLSQLISRSRRKRKATGIAGGNSFHTDLLGNGMPLAQRPLHSRLSIGMWWFASGSVSLLRSKRTRYRPQDHSPWLTSRKLLHPFAEGIVALWPRLSLFKGCPSGGGVEEISLEAVWPRFSSVRLRFGWRGSRFRFRFRL